MKKKPENKNLITVFVLIIGLFLFSGWNCSGVKKDEMVKDDNDRAIELAEEIFKQKKSEGMDMSSGPCLSNEIIPGWVVDVAHNPRQPIDNLPENQCSAYRDGRASHFVELDLDGNLIKAK